MTSQASELEFQNTLKHTLDITQEEIAQAIAGAKLVQHTGRDVAKEIVANFQPVPWVIWRLSNFVFGKSGRPNKPNEGMFLGLKKLLSSASADKVLGKGVEISKTSEVMKSVRSDVLAATSVIHSLSRKLKTKQFTRIWSPILEDALMRAHIGFFVGQMNLDFGPGRGMLAGFAGRIGLAILISSGTEEQAESALSLLSQGSNIRDAGLKVYSVDPLEVSAMTLSASGCGKDAAIGTISYAASYNGDVLGAESFEQKQWLAAFTITDCVRTSKMNEIPEEHWKLLGFYNDNDKEELSELVKLLVRRGHGWDWML